MTPEERDRLTRLEQRVEGLDAWMKSINTKLDELRTAAHMGAGAWWIILRLGAVLVSITAVLAWLFDRWPKK
jgi:hypothetical protein